MFGLFEQKKNFYDISKSIEDFNLKLNKINYNTSSTSLIMKINEFVIKYFDEPIVKLFLLEKYLPRLLAAKELSSIDLLLISLKEINQTEFIKKQTLPKLFSTISDIKLLDKFIGNLKLINLFEFESLKHLSVNDYEYNIIKMDGLHKFNEELIIFLFITNLKGFDDKTFSIHYFYKDKTYFYLQNKAQKEMLNSNEQLELFVKKLKSDNLNCFLHSLLKDKRFNKNFFQNLPILLDKIKKYEKEVVKEDCCFSSFVKKLLQQLVSEESSLSEFYMKELFEVNGNFKFNKSYLFMPKQHIFDRIKNSQYFENEVLLNYSFNNLSDSECFISNIPVGAFNLTALSHIESSNIIEALLRLGLLNLIDFNKSVPYFMDSSKLEANLRQYGLPFACYLILFGDEDLKNKVVEIIGNFNSYVSLIKKIEDCYFLKMFAEMLGYQKLSDFPMDKINFDFQNRLSVLGEAIFLHDFIKDYQDLKKLNTNCKDYFLSDCHLTVLEKLMPNYTVDNLIEIQNHILNLILESNMPFMEIFFYNLSFGSCFSYRKQFELADNEIKQEHKFSQLLFIPNKIFAKLLLNLIELKPLNNVFSLNFVLKTDKIISREDALNIVFGFQQLLNSKHDCFAKDKTLVFLNTLYWNNKIDFDIYSFLHSKISLNEEKNLLSENLHEIKLSFYLDEFVEDTRVDKMKEWFDYNKSLFKFFNQLKKTNKQIDEKDVVSINSYIQLLFYHTNFLINFN